MNNSVKKFLSLVLTLAICFSLMPSYAFAAEGETAEETSEAQPVSEETAEEAVQAEIAAEDATEDATEAESVAKEATAEEGEEFSEDENSEEALLLDGDDEEHIVYIYYANESEFDDNPNVTEWDSSLESYTFQSAVKAGYTFVGWYQNEDFSGDKVTVIPKNAAYDSIELWAKFTENTYTVSFDANKGSGTMTSMKYKYSEEKALTKNTFTRTGYEFIEWNTESDGSGDSYSDKELIQGVTSTPNDIVHLYAQWQEITYTVILDPNHDDETAETLGSYKFTEEFKLKNEFTYEGHTFLYWSDSTEDGGKSYSDNETVSKLCSEEGAEITLYAHWDEELYTIKFDSNGGSGSISALENLSYTSYQVLPTNTFTRAGYEFLGWSTDPEAEAAEYTDREKIYVKDLCGEKQTVTLYAIWSEYSYTIWFYPNGADDTAYDQGPVHYSEKINLSPNAFEYPGYTFTNWSTKQDGTGYGYADEAEVSKLSEEEDGTVKLYAQWEENTYTIKFDSNGGTGTMSDQEDIRFSKSVNLIANKFSKDGYKFAGWSESPSGEVKYTDKQSVSGLVTENEGEIILYAQWTENTYNIVFKANGGTGTMSKMTNVPFSTLTELYPNTFTRTGYTFDHWNMSADDSDDTDYADEQQVKELTSVDGGTITLYAQWYEGTYDITFDKNSPDAEGSMSPLEKIKYTASETLPANEFTREGYTFDKWNTEDDGTGVKYNDKAKISKLGDSGATTTLYAQWKENKYTVSYNSNGGTGSIASNNNILYTAEYTVKANTFKRDGYTFNGWNTESDGSGTPYFEGELTEKLSSENGGKVVLYAQWLENTYTIVFSDNGIGATGSMEDIKDVAYSEVTELTANGYEKDGYTFTGWNTKANGKGTKFSDGASVSKLSKVDKDNVTLYAQWTENTYTIAYDANGGTGTMSANKGIKYSSSLTLKANTFKRVGYEFTGWNTDPEGNGDPYSDKEVVGGLTEENSATVTLYAQWGEYSYTLIYSGNGATGGDTESPTDPIMYSDEFKLTANGFVKEGYVFTGWNTKTTGKGTSYEDEATVSGLGKNKDEVVTLYAQWKEKTYNIVYDANGGTGSMTPSKSLKYTAETTLKLNKFKQDGFEFKGWYIDDPDTLFDNGDKVTGSDFELDDGETVTLLAKWGLLTYNVEFNGNGADGEESMTGLTDLKYEESYDLPANAFTRDGYEFTGWSTKANGSGTKFADEATISKLTKEDGKTVTLYAQWKEKTYNIVYDANGATGSMTSSKNLKYTAKTVLKANSFKYDGYAFMGWYIENTGATFENKAVVTGATFGLEDGETVTLLAKWEPLTYNIEFSANGGEGEMTGKTDIGYEDSYEIPSVGFTRAGYEFTGWNTKANGSGTKIADEATVSKLSKIKDATVTLYAQWTEIKYTIAYNAYEGTGSMSNDKNVRFNAEFMLRNNSYKKTGFTFTGWSLNEGGSAVFDNKGKISGQILADNDIEVKNGDIITLYAVWEENSYSIWYYDEFPSSISSYQEAGPYLYSDELVLMTSEYDREGYTFAGWNSAKLGNGKKYADQATVSGLSTENDGIAKLYAQWTENSYTIEFAPNGADAEVKTQVLTYTKSAALTANTFKYPGYTFAGWEDDDGNTYKDKATVSKLCGEAGGTITLYAQWNANTYTVKYNANGGTGTMASTTATYDDDSETIPECTFTRKGYTFVGWNTVAKGTGTDYEEGDALYNLTTGTSVTLYALWVKD